MFLLPTVVMGKHLKKPVSGKRDTFVKEILNVVVCFFVCFFVVGFFF